MKLTRCFGTISLLLLAACGPSEQWTEAKRIACLDKFCEGDVEPKHDLLKEVALKLKGQWFIGPREYFSTGGNEAVIYWPSRTPGYRGGQYPEKGQPFYDIAIEVFLRSTNIPGEPRGYKLIELAEANGWIESRRTVRHGLDAITMKHVIGPRGQFIDHVTYYLATGLTGGDGKPPVATCSHDDPRNGGGTGFMWQPGIWAGTRMNQRQCADWPEIYLETVRVLQLLQRAHVHATDGVSAAAGLGTLLGASQAVRIEGDAANPLANHSIVKLGDALAVHELYGRLEPGLSASQIEAQFLAAGYRDSRLEGALDALRTVFIGSASNDTNKTPTGNRDRLYTNLYLLQNDSGFKSLSGQVQLVEAGVGFVSLAQAITGAALAYRYALLELLPFSVVANTDAQNQTLYGNYTQRLSLYNEATGQGELTKQWLADRADMLVKLVTRNRLNAGAFSVPGAQGMHYKDAASGTEFDIGLPDTVVEKRQTQFGGDAADSLWGKKLEDHLYGGGGNDTLLGGAGTDTYTFNIGWGHDTIGDGLGSIVVSCLGTLTGAGSKRIAADVWQSAERTINYTLLAQRAGRNMSDADNIIVGGRVGPVAHSGGDDDRCFGDIDEQDYRCSQGDRLCLAAATSKASLLGNRSAA